MEDALMEDARRRDKEDLVAEVVEALLARTNVERAMPVYGTAED
ncbi:hypothetical protein [Pseudarthrobacter sp. NPDC080039]